MIDKILKNAASIRWYALVAFLLFSFVSVGYALWKRAVEVEAMTKWNKKQLELVQEEQIKFNEQTKAIAESLQKIREDREKAKKELDARLSDIDKLLDSPEVVEDEKKRGLSSPILRETIRRLGGQK